MSPILATRILSQFRQSWREKAGPPGKRQANVASNDGRYGTSRSTQNSETEWANIYRAAPQKPRSAGYFMGGKYGM